MLDWVPVIVGAVAIMSFIFGLFKWQQSITSKNDEERQKANIQKHADMEKLFDAHKETFKDLKASVEKNDTAIKDTREEMHRDYVHRDQHQDFTKGLQETFDKIFKKVDSMAKDLNQLIGSMKNGSN